jgi:hypothetical protein
MTLIDLSPHTRMICYRDCGTSFGWDQLVFRLFADFGSWHACTGPNPDTDMV